MSGKMDDDAYSRKHDYDVWGAPKSLRTAVVFKYKWVCPRDSHFQLTRLDGVYIISTSYAEFLDKIRSKYDSSEWDVESYLVITNEDRNVEALSESTLSKALGYESNDPYTGKRVEVTLRKKSDAAGFAAFDRDALERQRKKKEDEERAWRVYERLMRTHPLYPDSEGRNGGGPAGATGTALPRGAAPDGHIDALISMHNRLSRLESKLG